MTTFARLKYVSFFHSLAYTALLIVAFGFNNPQPETFILGLSHGVLWIAMSLVCLAAVRCRRLPLRVAVAVAVLGNRALFRKRGVHPGGPPPSARAGIPDRLSTACPRARVRIDGGRNDDASRDAPDGRLG